MKFSLYFSFFFKMFTGKDGAFKGHIVNESLWILTKALNILLANVVIFRNNAGVFTPLCKPLGIPSFMAGGEQIEPLICVRAAINPDFVTATSE